MVYKLEYEIEQCWRSLYHPRKGSLQPSIRPAVRHKYVWYQAQNSTPVSPYFSQLRAAREWYEQNCLGREKNSERRSHPRNRRLTPTAATLACAKHCNRRQCYGRRWADQIARYAY